MVDDVVGSDSGLVVALVLPSTPQVLPPTPKQVEWDGRDAQAHALIALYVMHAIIPHILSCEYAKDAWDTLAHLYQV